jgi:hypothetical protein
VADERDQLTPARPIALSVVRALRSVGFVRFFGSLNVEPRTENLPRDVDWFNSSW